jgi:hypothetical protein
VIGTGRQETIEHPADLARQTTEDRRAVVIRELGFQRGVRVEDDRQAMARAREQGDQEPFGMMGMDDVEGPLREQPPESCRQQSVDDEQLAHARPRIRPGIAMDRSNPVDPNACNLLGVAEVIGRDVNLMPACGQSLGKPADADRRAPPAGKRAGGHHGYA